MENDGSSQPARRLTTGGKSTQTWHLCSKSREDEIGYLVRIRLKVLQTGQRAVMDILSGRACFGRYEEGEAAETGQEIDLSILK